MPDLAIQTTAKFIKWGAILAALVFVALEIASLTVGGGTAGWWLALPFLVLLWPAARGERLRYETGVASKSTRNIQLSKIQDVRVDQRLLQRIFNVGYLSIETAGEASRLTIHNVDDPQALADELMNRVQKGPAA